MEDLAINLGVAAGWLSKSVFIIDRSCTESKLPMLTAHCENLTAIYLKNTSTFRDVVVHCFHDLPSLVLQ